MSFDVVTLSADVPQDVTPDLDEDAMTDSDAPYGYTPTGRVRKRPVGASRGERRQTGGSNEKLARQAAKTLIQLHETLAFPLHMFGLPATAAALTDEKRNEGFEEQLFSALLPDAGLCRSITRFGGASARTSLTLAYVMFGMSIATTAYPELKEIAAVRKARAGTA